MDQNQNICEIHHSDQDFFCKTCGKLLCHLCLKKHEHKTIEGLDRNGFEHFKFEKYLGKGAFGYVVLA